jgi:amino acid adenylation domain-containing protein
MLLVQAPDSGAPPRTLADLVSATARLTPSNPALELPDRTVTYGALVELASSWAGTLQTRAPHAQRIGVLGSRSLLSYVGALAASWMGAAFVPINPRQHRERMALVARLSLLDAIICEHAYLSELQDVLACIARPVVVFVPDAAKPIDIPGAAVISLASQGSDRMVVPASPVGHELAYLLFTSGTTGVPKGVGVTNANVLAYIRSARARFDFLPSDRFSQMFDQSFDVSIFDLFVAWSCGACVVQIDAAQLIAPASYIEEKRLTVFSSVPSVLSLMRQRRALRAGRFPDMRYSMFAGEALSVENAIAWAEAAPNAVVENLYGPTEATVVCAGYRWTGLPSESLGGYVPIGRPFEGCQTAIVNEHGADVIPGELGELLVAGVQTVPGYWQDAELTARKFVGRPNANGEVVVFYRTGDLVRLLPSGDIAYAGRTDDQLKIMGRRIEPGEIEAAARAVDGVMDAVAVGWPLQDGKPVAITLFITTDAGDEEAVATTVSSELASTLDAVFVPRRVVVEHTLPLNANGKVDRRALITSLEQQFTAMQYASDKVGAA